MNILIKVIFYNFYTKLNKIIIYLGDIERIILKNSKKTNKIN